MIRFYLPLLLLTLLTACGRAPVLNVDPTFAPYVTQFEQEASNQGQPVTISDLIVQFGPMDSAHERGACTLSGDDTPVVNVNQDTWARIPESEREELIFHELGHCVLKRAHRADVDADGVAESIMSPYSIEGDVYELLRPQYVSELFAYKDTI